MSIGHKAEGGGAVIRNSPVTVNLNFTINVGDGVDEQQKASIVEAIVNAARRALGNEVPTREFDHSETISGDDFFRSNVWELRHK